MLSVPIGSELWRLLTWDSLKESRRCHRGRHRHRPCDGRTTAVRLAAEGAHVFIFGRRRVELDAAVDAIGAESATAVTGDVSNLADLDELYNAVRTRGRGLDVLKVPIA